MKRYVAFLRGVSPQNAKMPAVKRAFELAGFEDVRTVLSSGNVVFSASSRSEKQIARRAEEAMAEHLPTSFATTVRSVDALRDLIERDPFAAYELAQGAKRVVTFLFSPPKKEVDLPLEMDGAVLLGRDGSEVFCVYVPSPRGPVFMRLIERTFGKEVTTRTWDTVLKCAK